MAVQIIRVRKKNNHGLTRTIKQSAISAFERRGWELIPGQEIETKSATVEVKKKDVELAEAPAEASEESSENDGPFAPVENDDQANPVDSLREDYKRLSGKDADKRWKAERLNDEISKLQ